MVFQRADLKLTGNSGKVPDAIRAVFVNGVLASDPDQKVRLEPDSTGQLSPRLIYKASDVTVAGGQSSRSITLDANTSTSEVRKIIDRERKRAGFGPIDDVDFNLVREQIADGIQTLEQPEIIFRPSIDLLNFRFGLLKIAYELAWLWLGETYLDDPTGILIRRLLAGELEWEESELRGTVELGAELPALRFWAGDKTSHIAFVMTTGGRVGICIRIFQAVSAVISVSENPELHGLDPRVTENSQFIAIDPASGATRHTSLVEEFGRLRARQVAAF